MIVLNSFSQLPSGLPSYTAITHYKLSVGYYTTTVLIFPSAIDTADRGQWDLMAQKQPGVKNVLKLKARHKDFNPTNLHVFMSNGRIYAFDVIYSSTPPQTTYDLTKLDSVSEQDGPPEIIEFSKTGLNNEQLVKSVEKVRQSKNFFSSSTRKYRMKLQLQTIYLSDNILLFGFEIANQSNLPYDIDFARLYIRDKQKVKRSSLQQRDIMPLYKDTATSIAGNTAVKWVVAVSKFTIPDHRQLVLEVYEKNGGRYVTLEVTNRQLFKAKRL
jgi:conjugative transposon TraN protein